jgi:hypothetical protein
MKSTPHELREKCFTALKSALMSNSGHMLKLGLVGIQVCSSTNTYSHLQLTAGLFFLLSENVER